MREHGIRHLPVLDGGRLAGVVSERDLLFIDKLVDVDHERVPVSEAMSQDVYAVSAARVAARGRAGDGRTQVRLGGGHGRTAASPACSRPWMR